jgi:hypothetical protein
MPMAIKGSGLLALFCFPVYQRHDLARKSFAFDMKLSRMMRQRRVSFFAEALAVTPGHRSEWDASEIIRFVN